MELVCKESRRPFSWFFNGDNLSFVRLSHKGRINGEISGINLPNPLDIREARERAKSKGQLPKDARIEADPVIIKLWEYWNADKHNEF